MVSNQVVELGFIRLDARRNRPLFRQLYDGIRCAILDGQLESGVRIPSSRDLVSQLGVSRTTVVSAIDQLIAEGYLKPQVGSGTFVSEELPVEKPNFVAVPGQVELEPINQPDVDSYLSEQGNRLADSRLNFQSFVGMLKPFQPGIPALDEFPVSIWSQLSRRVWRDIRPVDMSYGEPAGYFPLRELIAKYLRAQRGVRCTPEQVMLVSGTQQAVDIIARLTLDPGDKVFFENPGYRSARGVFVAHGSELIPIPVDDQGMQVDQLTQNPQQGRLVYVTPSNQYPVGSTLSIERRLELIEWASANDAIIVEDDYDSEYRYSQKPIPALQGLDMGARTIYVGSFSKVVFPALSLGYVIVPEAMIQPFENALSIVSRPGSSVDQFVLYDFFKEGHFGRHLRRMRKTHSDRRSVFIDSLHHYLGNTFRILGGEAGLHCSAELMVNYSDTLLAKELQQIGIICRPLSEYMMARSPRSHRVNGLVFGFACAKPRQIRHAVRKMAEFLSDK